MPADLVPLAVRIAVRNAVGGWGPYTVRELEELFQSHGFMDHDPDTPSVGGVRRTTAESFQAAIDFGSPDAARRYLDLVDEVLENFPEDAAKPVRDAVKLRRELARAGIARDTRGRLSLPRGDGDAPSVPDEAAARLWVADRIRVFMSHTSANRAIVGDIARELNREAFSCFVAHDAIEPSRQWQDVIEQALRTADVLVAYVTPDFTTSRWTDQEVGWALGREIPVIPVKDRADPYGFFGAYQAVPVREGQATYETVTLIARAIAVAVFSAQRSGASRLVGRMADSVIDAFCRSRNFDATRRRYDLLPLIPASAWTDQHFELLGDAIANNAQVREAVLRVPGPRDAPSVLNELMDQVRSKRR